MTPSEVNTLRKKNCTLGCDVQKSVLVDLSFLLMEYKREFEHTSNGFLASSKVDPISKAFRGVSHKLVDPRESSSLLGKMYSSFSVHFNDIVVCSGGDSLGLGNMIHEVAKGSGLQCTISNVSVHSPPTAKMIRRDMVIGGLLSISWMTPFILLGEVALPILRRPCRPRSQVKEGVALLILDLRRLLLMGKLYP